MSGRGMQKVYSDPKHSSFRGCHVFLLGLMLVLCIPIFSNVQVSAGRCKPKNITVKYQHCRIHPDGVQNLDCFSKIRRPMSIYCTWKPGKNGSAGHHTLVLQQPVKNYCFVSNFTNLTSRSSVFYHYNFSAEVLENAETANCTKAVFRGSPKSLARCDPPNKVLLRRPPGELQVNVSWLPNDVKHISKFFVRYKELGSSFWNKSVESHHANAVRVRKLNPSSAYVVQIRCLTSRDCSQCPWSEVHTVPSELKTPPVIISTKYTDIANKTGCRLLSVTWKFPAKELHDGYRVTMWKDSGEPPQEQMNISQPTIRLILSYSAYQLNISAYNNASLSPAVTHFIPQHKDTSNLEAGRLNVTVHNGTAFTIYWRADLIRRYVCYSVDWMRRGRPGWYRSFFEDTNSNKTFSSLSEALEPYRRYSVTLHMRPYKNTCNMKHINNSEKTYGTTEFYLAEGAPVSAPTNIAFHNVTVNSVVLRWSEIPEEELRGFLLGYIIHYTEYHYKETSTVHNVTVNPGFTSFNMETLKSGTAYQVQISAFTSAGVGIRSAPSVFKTDHKVNFSISGAIAVSVFAACLLMFGSPVIKRAKAFLWPRVPNPEHSNAVQKIESPGPLELLKVLATLTVEEWDTKSLQILEKGTVIPSQTLPSMVPLLRTCEDGGDQSERPLTWSETDTDSETDDSQYDDIAETLPDTPRTQVQSSPLTFSGDYTTMEMFQQLIPQGMAADSSNTPSMESTTGELIGLKSVRLDYVRQFSTSPPPESKQMSTIL